MKSVVLLFCLSLVACSNASESYWCIQYESRQNPTCNTCFNSDVSGGKCTGQKLENCTIAATSEYYAGSKCIQCDPNYYTRSQDGVCTKVPQENSVENCVGYYQDKEGKITCSECGLGFMPGLSGGIPNNTCITTLYPGCSRQAFFRVMKGKPYYNCNLCAPSHKLVQNNIPVTYTWYTTCSPSTFEGCVDATYPDRCLDNCDWRVGYEVVGPFQCAKRQDFLLA